MFDPCTISKDRHHHPCMMADKLAQCGTFHLLSATTPGSTSFLLDRVSGRARHKPFPNFFRDKRPGSSAVLKLALAVAKTSDLIYEQGATDLVQLSKNMRTDEIRHGLARSRCALACASLKLHSLEMDGMEGALA